MFAREADRNELADDTLAVSARFPEFFAAQFRNAVPAGPWVRRF